MKPKPLVALKNLTVPEAFSPVSSRCGPPPPPRVARRAAILDRERIALDLEVGRRDPAAAIHQGEFERLAFGQAGQARLLDRADMDEHVLAAIVADDEAEALLAVEEFDDALGLADDLRGHAAAAAAAAAEPAAAAAAAAADSRRRRRRRRTGRRRRHSRRHRRRRIGRRRRHSRRPSAHRIRRR